MGGYWVGLGFDIHDDDVADLIHDETIGDALGHGAMHSFSLVQRADGLGWLR